MQGLFLFILLLVVLYYIGPTLLRWAMRFLMGHAIQKMQRQATNAQQQSQKWQRQQQGQTSHDTSQTPPNKPQHGEKIFKKTDGEYVDFEEIK